MQCNKWYYKSKKVILGGEMNIKYKRILCLSLVFNLLFILAVSAFMIKKGGLDYIKSKISNKSQTVLSDYHRTEGSVFSSLPQSKNKIVFAGDSLTDYGEWQELLQNDNIENRGIAGDTTLGLLDTINSISSNQPKEIFIMIGINDLNSGISVDTMLKNYTEIINDIKSNSPQTKIIIQSLLPVNDTINKLKVNNNEIIQANDELNKLAEENNLTFIDLHSLFVDEKGKLNKNLTVDGLHITGDGYLIWKQAIEKYIVSQ